MYLQPSPPLDNLQKAFGYSFEDICALLIPNQYVVLQPPHKGPTTFRKSELWMISLAKEHLDQHIGPPKKAKGSYLYQAEYILPPDFDMKQLDGNYLFHNGRLVESVLCNIVSQQTVDNRKK